MSSKSASRKLSGPGAVFLLSTSHGGSSDSFRSRPQRPAMNFDKQNIPMEFCRECDFHGAALMSAISDPGVAFQSCKRYSRRPPFYMMAIPTGGAPSVTLIGDAEDSLNWTVDQPVGSQLLLQVIDSQGSSGGVPPHLFTVVDGQTTQCIPPASNDPPFTVEANVTDTLTTCQPWGIIIKGGVRPYNVTLAAIDSPVVTNVTMGPNDDQFTFIDRADPNTQLIAAVSDLNGRWATGTPIVKTQGSSDVSCIGLVSSSGNSTVIAAQERAAAATSKARKKTAVIAGVVTTLLVLLLLGGVGFYLYLRRRRMQQTERELSPRQFEGGSTEAFRENDTQILSINAFIAPSSPRSPKSPGPSVLSHSVSTSAPSSGPSGRRYVSQSGSGSGPESEHSASSNGTGLTVRNPTNRSAAFSSFPTASVRRSAKEIEAGLHTSNSLDSEYFDGSTDVGSRLTIERSRSAVAVASP
ncbi:hypothetical protein MSAN_01160000 [Mycena sanguinolenta]|uniref:Uncharacterized protein n=1 Tax=Mycena sanguinolenta TaxID=230812 RepID=A0A8H6YM76_9AGAR|nr:hypothetical protein MSAN_01160000 [Mycena sanguinolenta]